MSESLPLLKGTLDVLVLQALAWTPMHGFELTRWLADCSGTAWDLDEAAIYQALYRLEARGLVVAEWGRSEKGRRARYYQLTKPGRVELQRAAARWRQYAAVVAAILDTVPEAR
jgi:transcriptional regulator